ncbi:hypothetical protein ASF49_05015 [Methylobacterium sp. Leaf104]|uniref:DUF72 domain-containing protein n=1 Tax=Methylobacterium TaxID=407 RepID=UPI0006F8BBCC|nr:DUF72 domain-containing protein [Methylobacterium sp. Leaf104]KQP38366.1 hypothetical protein ASF49_05015 [Methylobacterium sp. Leaf104]MCI9880230.1 DUF72 domain-containing protein [Methylobacterium goesingense]
MIAIGTAGWSVPKGCAEAFPADGSHLERYARRLDVVEINTSFHRPHRVETYARWAGATPEHFRFAVKLPRTITHEQRLQHVEAPLRRVLSEVAGLGPKLGPLLLQTPPSLRFDPQVSAGFLRRFRDAHAGSIVCEPRHASWFAPQVDALLSELRIARVAADPAPVPGAGEPGGWPGLRYHRLHGSPKIYVSAYTTRILDALAGRLAAEAAQGCESWCIFDNTAAFAATGDALALRRRASSPDDRADRTRHRDAP